MPGTGSLFSIVYNGFEFVKMLNSFIGSEPANIRRDKEQIYLEFYRIFK